ncbi:putative squalene/phytoene synthase [Magnetofaba australis IT-1]|uniref:Putative squalene/phytoene synthase n=2 Tax=Magnetofaba TaxID=1472292 RepID=A0A1Y2K3D9_9PROT|nr:putative squalene/phytoene synthase [Magnetofaba australis IT-1]
MLLMPAAQRDAMLALYAYCREVDDIVDRRGDPAAANLKLLFWRGELKEAFEGGAPRHPAARALQEAAQQFPLRIEPFVKLLDGMRMDLEEARYPDMAALEEYCDLVASAVGEAALPIFGADPVRCAASAQHWGRAFQLTNILRDVGEDAAMGRVYLPLGILLECGASPEDLLEGRFTPQVATAMARVADVAQAHYEQAEAMMPPDQRVALRPAIVMSRIYHAYLRELRAREYDVFSRRLEFSPWKKLWITFRTWRQEKRAQK